MMRLASRFFLRSAAILVFVARLAYAFNGEWSQAEQQLAAKVMAITGPGVVALEIRNRSSLTNKDSDEIARGLRDQLTGAGVRFVAAEQAAVFVTVTLSENLRNYVWVAEIRQGTNEPAVVMVSLPRPNPGWPVQEASSIVIHKTALWTQQDRILDAAVFEEMSGQSHLAVLSPEQISLFHFQQGHWQFDQAMPVQHSRPWPRDLRGRLVLQPGRQFDAYLPGVLCQSSPGAPVTIQCRESDDPWPLGGIPTLSAFFAPTRNFFTGVLSPGIRQQTSTSKFYSAAPIPRLGYALWVFAAVDGSQHLLDGATDQAAQWKWGSDIASVSSSCGAGTQVLATSREDSVVDSIRAYEFPDRDPVPVSPQIDFAGTVTALWSETSGKSAIVIVHNSEREAYEAFRLTIACGQ